MVNPYEWPREDDLVVCTVKTVKNFGAFVTLDEYRNKEGFIHIAEVASGWVKYIGNHIREGAKVVTRVLNVNPRKGHIDLSLKRVNDHQKRAKIQDWRREKKAEKLFELIAEQLGRDVMECYEDFGFYLIEDFGTLYSAFEAVTIDQEALAEADYDVEEEWVPLFIETATKNITPPYVNIAGKIKLFSPAPNGIEDIKEALKAAKRSDNADISITYVGAPEYRISVVATNYKVGEDELAASARRAIECIKETGGYGHFER